jgi:hypothetical protein
VQRLAVVQIPRHLQRNISTRVSTPLRYSVERRGRRHQAASSKSAKSHFTSVSDENKHVSRTTRFLCLPRITTVFDICRPRRSPSFRRVTHATGASYFGGNTSDARTMVGQEATKDNHARVNIPDSLPWVLGSATVTRWTGLARKELKKGQQMRRRCSQTTRGMLGVCSHTCTPSRTVLPSFSFFNASMFLLEYLYPLSSNIVTTTNTAIMDGKSRRQG